MRDFAGEILDISFISTAKEQIKKVFLQISGKWYEISNTANSEILEFNPCPDPFCDGVPLCVMEMIRQFDGLEFDSIKNFGGLIDFKFKNLGEKSLQISPHNDGLKIAVANYILKFKG